MKSFLIKSSAMVGAALLLSNLHADQEDPVYQLEDFVVSVGPIARPLDDYASPVTSLDSDAIRRAGGGTLGQLLDGQPGVNATSFGAGASRPIIRGFDGPRVRVIESGLGSLDVSETSPDHAVSVEPLLSDRVEVLRGPSTLLYGSSAIGGVVNVIGKEIPREPVDSKGYDGAFETRYDSVSEGETLLGYSTVGGDRWALRVTGLTRKADNYEIPGDAEAYHEDEEHEEEESGDELESSFVENDYFSVGGTWFFGEQNYIGASFSNYDAFYGVPGHAHHEEEEGEEEEHGE
ncbi:MAG: TonB-dependent receptor plug domain-containing protein, partial [Opitutales bacterium]|nr:TonB-dependent receptor plug domain-containing protein [Opitutales bacterium]